MNKNKTDEAPKYLHFAIPEFNEEKCKAAILVAMDSCNNDPAKLGKVRLHKILWFVEYFSLLNTRNLLFGGTFVKRQFGPYLKELNKTTSVLEQEGYISHHDKSGGNVEVIRSQSVKYGAIFEQMLNQFYPTDLKFNYDNILSKDEIMLIQEVTKVIGNMGVDEISELTHNIHWQMAEENEWLPVEFAHTSNEITGQDLKFDIDESEL